MLDTELLSEENTDLASKSTSIIKVGLKLNPG